MENASKALIIAGAILVSILLISLAIIMFNQSRGTTDQAKDAQEQMASGAQQGVNAIQNQLGQVDFGI